MWPYSIIVPYLMLYSSSLLPLFHNKWTKNKYLIFNWIRPYFHAHCPKICVVLPLASSTQKAVSGAFKRQKCRLCWLLLSVECKSNAATFNTAVFLWGPYLMAAAPRGRGSLLLNKRNDQKCPFQDLVRVTIEDPTFWVHHWWTNGVALR